MPVHPRRTLIVTLPLQWLGGVQSKARFLAAHLQQSGHQVTIAYYAGRTLRPDLNVGFLGSALGRPGAIDRFTDDDGLEHTVIGCRLPALEYPYTEASDSWGALIGQFDRIVAVGGTPLIAHPVVAAGKKAIVWCADDLVGDRSSRMKGMTWPRRQVDAAWVMPKLARQQAMVLQSGCAIRGVSHYSVKQLQSHASAQGADISRLPIPVDVDLFTPPAGRTISGRMGFAGRIADPRKNADLLFRAFRCLHERGIVRSLHLAGPDDPRIAKKAHALGIADQVHFLGNLGREQLPAFYRSLDVFAITSHREGLGIAGLEAMACGTPVVSTRCGGPEDFVIDGATGFLGDAEEEDFAAKVGDLLGDADRYAEISRNCRTKIGEEFSEPAVAKVLGETWHSLWSEDYRSAS